MKIHFLDVGDGDSTLIEFASGRVALIDIHTNHQYSKQTIAYIKKVLNGRDIFRFILTHPHQDHLHGLKDLVDNGIQILNFWHTTHFFEPQVPTDDLQKAKWELYKPHWEEYAKRQTKHIFTKENYLVDFLKDDCIEVLSPSVELDKQSKELKDNPNHVHRNNYVLRVSEGKFSAILTGDADVPCLNHLVEVEAAKLKTCVVLKAPHHGTDAHWCESFVKTCNPMLAILTQGEEREKNSVEKEYAKLCKVVAVTKKHGTIIIDAKSDGTFGLDGGDYTKILK
jgi:competence protein ComEC